MSESDRRRVWMDAIAFCVQAKAAGLSAAQVERELADVLRQLFPPERTWRHECAACQDTGWWSRRCPGDETCGRTRRHGPHGYTSVCSCRPTNRTYQREHPTRVTGADDVGAVLARTKGGRR